jgi:hypothetical protein
VAYNTSAPADPLTERIVGHTDAGWAGASLTHGYWHRVHHARHAAIYAQTVQTRRANLVVGYFHQSSPLPPIKNDVVRGQRGCKMPIAQES